MADRSGNRGECPAHAKPSYSSKALALEAGMQIRADRGGRVSAYYCSVGGGWHTFEIGPDKPPKQGEKRAA